MKYLIVNCGIEKQGKSASIKKVYHLLDGAYGHLPWSSSVLDEKGDIRALFEINEVKVGVESFGDEIGRMGESMGLFAEDERCGIIVVACHTRGGTRKKIDELAVKYKYTIIWTHNPRTSDEQYREEFNDDWAQYVVEMIRMLIREGK